MIKVSKKDALHYTKQLSAISSCLADDQLISTLKDIQSLFDSVLLCDEKEEEKPLMIARDLVARIDWEKIERSSESYDREYDYYENEYDHKVNAEVFNVLDNLTGKVVSSSFGSPDDDVLLSTHTYETGEHALCIKNIEKEKTGWIVPVYVILRQGTIEFAEELSPGVVVWHDFACDLTPTWKSQFPTDSKVLIEKIALQ